MRASRDRPAAARRRRTESAVILVIEQPVVAPLYGIRGCSGAGRAAPCSPHRLPLPARSSSRSRPSLPSAEQRPHFFFFAADFSDRSRKSASKRSTAPSTTMMPMNGLTVTSKLLMKKASCPSKVPAVSQSHSPSVMNRLRRRKVPSRLVKTAVIFTSATVMMKQPNSCPKNILAPSERKTALDFIDESASNIFISFSSSGSGSGVPVATRSRMPMARNRL
mmetsp:Transcript_23047/g.67971  ORF Transcript_23047/g.67971 Transcript_23047/m.67971 type:complete len:221 (+) Transcript_23047:149-811(+)